MKNTSSTHYQGERGRQYFQQRQSDLNHPRYPYNLSFFKPYLKPEHAVLDFGCGNGGLLRLVKPLVTHIDGLEVNPAAAEFARQYAVTVYDSLASLPQSPFYDIIISNHVLEHVRDVCDTLETLRACLKPGGLFITKLPLDDFRSRHQQTWTREDVDHHLYTWTPRLLANLFYETGYEVQTCQVLTSAFSSRLLPLTRLGLGSLACWVWAVLFKRRQLFVVAKVPA